MKYFLLTKIAPAFGRLYLKFLHLTSKVEVRGAEHFNKIKSQFPGVIYAFWHGRLLYLGYYHQISPLHKEENPTVLISQHGDGELVARMVEGFGINVVRGSTTRGGEAGMRALIRAVKKNGVVGITPDGPKGPFHSVHPGIIRLSLLTGFPILPLTYSWKRKKFLSSWDKFLLPLPFSKGIVTYGKPINIEGEKDVDKWSEILKDELNRITEETDILMEG